ncbi:MAG TPA: ABC transporter substrate-binding protein [Anaerolineae bacterium]|jgi:putative ABC transport system substrate-binding protein
MKCHGQLKYSSYLIVIFFIAAGLLLTACGGGAQAQETFIIGAVNYVPSLNAVFDGFKAGMTELGYVEGENITYIYNGSIEPDPEVIDREIESLMAQDVDLIFTMGTLPASRAKQAVQGTDIPVVFGPVINPVEEGIVDSIRQPGGSVTGVQNGITIGKALEWFLTAVPEATKVYVPYHPDDDVAVTSLVLLREAASVLGIELVLGEVHSQEEVIAAIEGLPEDTSIFIIPTPSLEPIGDFIKVATEQGIAVGSTNHSHLEKGALLTFGSSFFPLGKQAARMVDQALRGTKPADMPVETAEFFLNINLQTAAALGLEIPDEVLGQANTIIR